MTDSWAFDQPLDEKTPTSSAEERAKIAALFNKTDMAANEEVDYVATFEKQQKTQAKPIVSMSKNQPHSNQSKKPISPMTISNIWLLWWLKIRKRLPIAKRRLKSCIS